MPPAVDAQAHRDLAGAGWAWIDSAPTQGWEMGLGLEWAEDLLIAEDRDESYPVVPSMGEGTLSVSRMWGHKGFLLSAPIRWIPDRELGLGSAQASAVLAWDSGLTARGTVILDSDMGWASSWSSPRIEAAVSWSSPVVSVGGSTAWGEDGWESRAAVGVSALGMGLEAAWSHAWTEVPAGTIEVGAGRILSVGNWDLRPFASVGIGSAPGTPSYRAILSASRTLSGRHPAVAESNSQGEANITPTPPPQVEPTATGVAQAGPDEERVPFPPTTPDVPAFSIPIVEVDPAEPPKDYKGVSQVSGVLASNPQILLVEIRVHSECAGGGAAALRASEVAAARIRDFIVSQGIDEGRLRMVPSGCTRPVRSPEVTAEDRAANRRIEVVVVEVSESSP